MSDAITPLTATGAELVGNYAIRIDWSDGHSSGIYSWAFLRELHGGGTSPEPADGSTDLVG